MLKVSLAAAALVLTGTTATYVALDRGNDAKPAPAATTPTAGSLHAAAAPHTSRTPAIAPPTHPTALPHAAPSLPHGDDDAPVVISKQTRDQLDLERGPSRGPANAPVTIVVFQDLLCQYCGKVLGTIDQLWDEYPGKLKLVVKQFPVHDAAKLAAEASLAADAQGKFWELHDAMIAHQEDLSRDAIVGYAHDAGLDAVAIASALDQHTYASALTTEVNAALEVGVTATPEFLINGKDFRGAQPIENFRAAIDAALAEVAANP